MCLCVGTCVCGCRAEREVSCVLQSFYLCVCVFIKCSCRRLQRPEEGVGSPEVVAAGGCVLPEEDLGNQTLVLHRNDRYSSHWIHLHLSTLCFETRSVTPISDSPDWPTSPQDTHISASLGLGLDLDGTEHSFWNGCRESELKDSCSHSKHLNDRAIFLAP